ncbi:hypothetical protein ACLKA6_004115 [Drosophila palustris]
MKETKLWLRRNWPSRTETCSNSQSDVGDNDQQQHQQQQSCQLNANPTITSSPNCCTGDSSTISSPNRCNGNPRSPAALIAALMIPQPQTAPHPLHRADWILQTAPRRLHRAG